MHPDPRISQDIFKNLKSIKYALYKSRRKTFIKQKHKMLTEKFEREEHILIDEEYRTENTRNRVQIVHQCSLFICFNGYFGTNVLPL